LWHVVFIILFITLTTDLLIRDSADEEDVEDGELNELPEER